MVDSRYVFLVRASARLRLVDHGFMDLGEAVDGLAPAMLEFIPQCACINKTLARWEQMDRRRKPHHKTKPRRAA